MKLINHPALLAVVVVAALSACVHTEFKIYEGRNNVVEGKGGTKTIVDGMEVWDYGEPPRKFVVLGFVQDERPGAIIPMSQLRSDVVKVARQAGGDAIIQVSSQSQIVGYYSSGTATANTIGRTTTATGSAFTMPVARSSSSFVVIRFEEDASRGSQALAADAKRFAGYWNVAFSGATSGDCQNLLIDIQGHVSGVCRLLVASGSYGQSFTVSGTVDSAGKAALTATTGASMSGAFTPAAGSGTWANEAASGTWSAARI